MPEMRDWPGYILLQTGPQSILELADVHRDDGGVYLCQLSNEHGELEQVQAEISVLEEPARVVFSPGQVHLRLGQEGTVPCYIRQPGSLQSQVERGYLADTSQLS